MGSEAMPKNEPRRLRQQSRGVAEPEEFDVTNGIMWHHHRDANRFARVGFEPPRCSWRRCREQALAELPVCEMHALAIAAWVNGAMSEIDRDAPSPLEEWNPQPFVYYLMVGPYTVKIGTTRDLVARLQQLRTDAQYVVAIEYGDRKIERERHLQFAAERIGRREDFTLTDRLKRHIKSLQPNRDDLVRLATTRPLPQAG